MIFALILRCYIYLGVADSQVHLAYYCYYFYYFIQGATPSCRRPPVGVGSWASGLMCLLPGGGFLEAFLLLLEASWEAPRWLWETFGLSWDLLGASSGFPGPS